MGPTCRYVCPYRRRQREFGDSSHRWTATARVGPGKDEPPWSLRREHGPACTLTLDLRPPDRERLLFCCSNASLCALLWPPRKPLQSPPWRVQGRPPPLVAPPTPPWLGQAPLWLHSPRGTGGQGRASGGCSRPLADHAHTTPWVHTAPRSRLQVSPQVPRNSAEPLRWTHGLCTTRSHVVELWEGHVDSGPDSHVMGTPAGRSGNPKASAVLGKPSSCVTGGR